MLNRRQLLNLTAATTLTSLLPNAAQSAEPPDNPLQITDTNIHLHHWPFRRLPLDETTKLVKKLRTLGITRAWAGSFEALLHRDLTAVNLRLAEECKPYPELIPIGAINPELPGWEEDLRRCAKDHNMPGIRLHPNYHGYTLEDSRFEKLLKLATAQGLFIQIAVTMEDTRTQHPNLCMPDVDLAPLPNVMKQIPIARVQILNHHIRPPLLDDLAKTPGIYFDTARVEGTDGVPTLVDRVPPGRVLFGTHAPFLIPEAALIRVHESGKLDETALRAVYSDNAKRLLKKTVV